MSSSSQNHLIAFFEGSGPDPYGRYLRDILRWSDRKLEGSHDYIQTLFPLPEPSGMNWDAEVVDETVFKAFRAREDLQTALRAAFARILSFYGFKIIVIDGELRCRRQSTFNVAAQNWVYRYDHNHLRITRIIRSLRVLGLESEAQAFYGAVKDVQAQSSISDTSLRYWTRAMERPLNIRPDEEGEHETMGPQFLREFVKNQQQPEEISKDEGEDDFTEGKVVLPDLDNVIGNDEVKEGAGVRTDIEGTAGDDGHTQKTEAPPNINNTMDDNGRKKVGDLSRSIESAANISETSHSPWIEREDTDNATDKPEEIAPPLTQKAPSPLHHFGEANPLEIKNENGNADLLRSEAEKEAVENEGEEREISPKLPVS